jgi:RNA polymerase sigma factor (sigma-70 family)
MVPASEKEEFINRIVAENNDRFHLIACYFAPPDEDMDLYQEIVYALWESLDRFEGRSSPGTWARALAMNTAFAYRRKISSRNKTLREYAQNMPSQQLGGRDWKQISREFLQSLPEMDCRILMHYMAGLSTRQIAEETGLNESTIRSKITRLKDLFKKRYL